MKTIILIILISLHTLADTPPPNTVKAKVYDGSGSQAIGNVSDSLKVNVTNSTSVLPTNAATASNQTDGSQKSQVVDGSGNVWGPRTGLGGVNYFPVINLEAATSGSAVAGRTLQVGGSDGTNLRTFSTNASGVLNTLSAQSGTWTTGRTWSLLNTTDSVNSVQSGTWNTGRTWTLLNTTDSVNVGNFPSTFGVTQSTSPWVISGTVTANAGTGNFTVVQPTGTNLHTVVDSGTISATQGTSPWVVSGTVAATQSGAWTTGRTWSLLNTTDSVNVGNFPATQPVSGTVTANQGTSPWVSNISQFGGSNVVTGTGASGAGIPRVTVSNDSNVLATQSGTWTTGRTWSLLNTTDSVNAVQSGTWTTGRTWTLSSGTDSVAATQSGTWNINNISGTISLPTGAATSANQTNGTQQTKITDGTNLATVKAASTAPTATDTALVVALSPNGNQATGVAQGSTTSGQSGTLMQGAVTTNSPSYTTAQTSPLSLNVRGGLRSVIVGGDTSQLIRNNYSTTNVTTAAYVQLVASTANNINRLWIFDSSGQDLVLAVGAAAAEVDQIQISPGGWDSSVDLFIPSGSRISIKAVSASATSGTLLITGIK